MQHFCENCCILGLRHAVSSKFQGTVKIRKFKKVRTLNSTRILTCNPGAGSVAARAARVRAAGEGAGAGSEAGRREPTEADEEMEMDRIQRSRL